MKITRSSKCSIKFATNKKKDELQTVLIEYGNVVNIFIDHFWINPTTKNQLLKPIVDIPQNTWLSARLRKEAAREALDMVDSVKKVFDWNKQQKQNSIDALTRKIKKTDASSRENRRKINNWHKKLKATKHSLSMMQPHKPKHKGNTMSVSCTIGELQRPKNATKADAWLHLSSIGNKTIIDIPIKFHKHYLGLNKRGRMLHSFIITKEYVQFCFEIETGPKKEVNNIVGINTGINALASTSDKLQFGTDIKLLIEKSKRCKKGSKGKQRAVSSIKQRINEVAKEVISNKDLIVVEKLKNLNLNSKLKERLSRNVRSSIGNWNYAYWLMRLKQLCEDNRVSFRTVSPYNTSITCSVCKHADSKNRDGESFKCQSCGYTDNADVNAALNILTRFLTGTYGSCYRPKNTGNLGMCKIVQV